MLTSYFAREFDSMKHSKYHLALTLAIALNVSCSRFEDGPAFSFIPAESRLTGEWVVVQVDDPNGGTYSYFEYLMDEGGGFVFEFDDNDEGLLKVQYEGYSYGNSFEWDLEGDELELFFTSVGVISTFEIQRLTRREMTMKSLSEGLGPTGMVWTLEKN